MVRTALISLGALSLVAVAHTPLRAQGSAQSVQLAFGYECGDRFMVRNDGNNPVVVEYAVSGSQDRSQLHLDGLQSKEIASAQSGNLELWVNGKVVASEPKGNRACGATQASGVNVRPMNQEDAQTAAQPGDSTYTAAPVVVYAQPPYYYDDYYGYPYYPYAYYGYSPFLYPSIGIYGGFGRGFGGRGFIGRGGVTRGPTFRGGGRRR
jgi:hypothetical protein